MAPQVRNACGVNELFHVLACAEWCYDTK